MISTRCTCGGTVTLTPATLAGHCDEDGFAVASADATHCLVNCTSSAHQFAQTIAIALHTTTTAQAA